MSVTMDDAIERWTGEAILSRPCGSSVTFVIDCHSDYGRPLRSEDTVLSLRERKKDKTRTQLLEAALELIGRQGFADTTINQIAAAVDVSPRTLLRYFPSKEDVIVSWIAETITIFVDTLTARPREEAAQQSLMAAARAMLEAYQQRSEFYLVIEKTIASSPSISARKQEMSAALAEKVEKHLQARAGSDFDSLRTEVLTAIVFSLIRISIRRWLATDGEADLLSVFDKAKRIVPLTEDNMACMADAERPAATAP